jgi:hypothetical protein
MKRIALGVFSLLTGAAQAYEFKGLEVGGPTTYGPNQVEAALNQQTSSVNASGSLGRVKCGEGGKGGQVCNGPTSVAGVYARTNTVTSTEGVVTRISLTFSSRSFDTVEAGVLSKYGEPTKTEQNTVQNRMGATYQNVEHTWEGEGGRYIRLSKYAGSLDDSTLYFGTAEDTAKFAPKPDTNDL